MRWGGQSDEAAAGSAAVLSSVLWGCGGGKYNKEQPKVSRPFLPKRLPRFRKGKNPEGEKEQVRGWGPYPMELRRLKSIY